ncbi:ABC transporter ATP-binding protein, partial [Clostridioides difficile]
MPILEILNLGKIYGKKETAVHALKDANLKINKGEFVAIIGPSGSGKSTFLHLVGGLERPSSGTIKVDGKDICCLSDKKLAKYRRQKVGFVFQQYNLIPVLNVKENIELPLKLDNKKVDEEYIEDIINLLGLSERKNHLPNQ